MQHEPNRQPEDQLLSDLLNLRNLFSNRSSWLTGGWRRQSPTGSLSYCIMGGIQQVVAGEVVPGTNEWRGYFRSKIEIVKRITDLILTLNKARRAPEGLYGQSELFYQEDSLIGWNDSPSMDHSTIVRTIDKAIQARMEERTLATAKEAVNAV